MLDKVRLGGVDAGVGRVFPDRGFGGSLRRAAVVAATVEAGFGCKRAGARALVRRENGEADSVAASRSSDSRSTAVSASHIPSGFRP